MMMKLCNGSVIALLVASSFVALILRPSFDFVDALRVRKGEGGPAPAS